MTNAIEIYRSTFNQQVRKRLSEVAAALGVDHDFMEADDYVKAYFPPLLTSRSPVIGCWVVVRPSLNAGPHDYKLGVTATIRLPEKVLTPEEALAQADLLSRLAPHVSSICLAFSNHRVKDD